MYFELSVCWIIVEMTSASKNIVAELNKGEKLNGDNYDIWYRKIQYILEEQKTLKALNNTLTEPKQGNTAQQEGSWGLSGLEKEE